MKQYLIKSFCILLINLFMLGNCDAAKKTNSNNRKTSRVVRKENKEPAVAKQEILMDFDTLEILSEKDSQTQCVPSSMTKLMTIYLVFNALHENKLHLDDEIPVSKAAQKQEGSRSFFKAGTLAKVEDLVRSVIVHSGNDACVVLADKISGNEEEFADKMNEKAQKFGLVNSHFVNSTGLPDDDHYSCLYDIAIISRRIILDFPEYYHYFSEKSFTVNDITQQNRNTLIGNSLNVDGLKTGQTKAGGYGIAISAKKDGKRLIAVVNGCKSAKNRAEIGNKILAMGFNSFVPVKISDKHNHVGTADVLYGKKDKVNLCTKEDVVILVPKKYKESLVIEVEANESAKAPIAVGQKLGALRYKYGTYISKDYELFAQEPINEMNLFEKTLSYAILSVEKIIDYLKSLDKNKVEAPISLNKS